MIQSRFLESTDGSLDVSLHLIVIKGSKIMCFLFIFSFPGNHEQEC